MDDYSYLSANNTSNKSAVFLCTVPLLLFSFGRFHCVYLFIDNYVSFIGHTYTSANNRSNKSAVYLHTVSFVYIPFVQMSE